MEKLFKRTLVGAAVASTMMFGTTAFASGAETSQVGIMSDFNVEAYGVAAISVFAQEDGTGYNYDNESRIGFRASKDMLEGVNVFMQIESGYVGENGDGATLGNRDTFIGLQGDMGKVRFGRMLTPLYEIVDWPYSNPGLGRVFDWGGDVKAHYDRKGDIARYDSPTFGGFNFSLSAGRGDVGTDGSNHFGASVHYNVADVVTLHGGYEHNTKYGGSDIDSTTYIAGFELPLAGGFSIAGAYKYNEGESKHTGQANTESDDNYGLVDYSGQEASQGQYSLIAQYWNGPVGVKVGYAYNEESEVNGKKLNDDESVISGQIMYVKNGFVPYLRVGSHNAYNDGLDGKDADKMFVRVGLEYGF